MLPTLEIGCRHCGERFWVEFGTKLLPVRVWAHGCRITGATGVDVARMVPLTCPDGEHGHPGGWADDE